MNLKVGDRFYSDKITSEPIMYIVHEACDYGYWSKIGPNMRHLFQEEYIYKLVRDNKLNRKLYPNHILKDGFIHIKGVKSDE